MPLPPLPAPVLLREGTAIVVVDMQYFDAHPEYGLAKLAEPGELDEYFEQLRDVIPRIRHVQDCARAHGIPVFHVHLCSRAPGGADMCRTHRLRGWSYPAGSKEAEFLPEVAPLPDEVVIEKTSSGAFNSGRLEEALRAAGIERIVVCGVDTRFCVETTVRDASDRSFEVVLVADACASKTRELHQQGVDLLRDTYCVVMTTDELTAAVARAAPTAA